MILNKMFSGTSMEFTKRCKLRIAVSTGIMVLGAVALAVSLMYGTKIQAMDPGSPEKQSFIQGFYSGTGGGLIAAGLITIIRYVRILNNEELKKKRALYENDERNQYIGTKCWAYAGYALFLCLYVGILVSGFISMTVLKVLLCVLGVYGGLLLIFKLLLQKYV